MPTAIRAASAASVAACPETYTTSVVSNAQGLDRLQEDARHLLVNVEDSCLPGFFRATVGKGQWVPRVVSVKQDGDITGLVYAKERLVAGMRTGLIYADSTLGTMVIADPSHRGMVLLKGLRALLEKPGIRGVRMLVPPESYEIEILRELQRTLALDFHAMPVENHSVLPLGSSYESFLEKLSPKTRRNFRYFRKRSELAGHQFVEEVPIAEFEAAAMALLRENVVGGDREGVARGMDIFRAAKRPMLAGLRAENGEWLSLLGGWYESNRVVLFLQMNSDKKYAAFSLSLVMRTHVIETLIARGCRDAVWWAGVGAPINHYVEQVPTTWVYLDKRSFGWRAFRRVLDSQRARLPQSVAPIAEWIVPRAVNGTHRLAAEPE